MKRKYTICTPNFIIYLLTLAFFAFNTNGLAQEVIVEEINRTTIISEDIKEVFCQSFEDNYRPILPKQLRTTFNDFEDVKNFIRQAYDDELQVYLVDSSVHLFVAKLKETNATIGMVFFQLLNTSPSTIHIRQMAVLPSFQRQSVGSKLLHDLVTYKANNSIIVADTRALNQKALGFYLKHGFTVCDAPNDKELDPMKYKGLKKYLYDTKS